LHLDGYVALSGLLMGLLVGLTGMGGGALLTPVLVLVFGVQPLAAVGGDLVSSLVTKPVGAAVHYRRGTVNRRLVGWLTLGSAPAAFAGALLVRGLRRGTAVQSDIKTLLGATLLLAAAAVVVKGLVTTRRRSPQQPAPAHASFRIKPVSTVVAGAVVGLLVGMTSVGSGSLMIVALMLLYPRLRSSELVGTNLVQAVPLVGAAAVGHLIFGDFRLGLTASIVLGSLPGVYVGARLSSRAPDAVIRPVVVVVLIVSALKLLEVGNLTIAAVSLAAGAGGLAATARGAQRRSTELAGRAGEQARGTTVNKASRARATAASNGRRPRERGRAASQSASSAGPVTSTRSAGSTASSSSTSALISS